MKQPKLLLITRNAWANENSTGNTMSNLFSGWEYDIANIFCRDESINNSICKKYYRITERELINNILKKTDVGAEIVFDDVNGNDITNFDDENIKKEKKRYDFFKAHKLQIFLWGRELLWKFGKWKNDKFDKFLKDYNPDIILMPMHSCLYMYDILLYVHKITGAKIALWTGDDMYTLKQFSVSPFFWIDRFMRRAKIRKVVKLSSLRISSTDKQSSEYSKIFGKEFVTYCKGVSCQYDYQEKRINSPLNLVYTGNMQPGRYIVLGRIAEAIEKINKKNEKMQLHLYSGQDLTPKMKKCFNHKGVFFHGSVSNEEVKKVQNESDVMIHVEDFCLRNRLKVRLSFSTKIIDYLSAGKCILAVGPETVASMDYLIKNDVAVIATNEKEIEEKLRKILENTDMIREYEKKAWECGKKNHQIDKIQERLYDDLKELIQ